MDNHLTPIASSSRRSVVRFWPWLMVLLVLLFVGFIRVRLLDMPLERDEGEYAYAGQLILQGIPPYELAYNMKLPGTYCAYAAGMAVFGQTAAGIHLTLLVANSLTIVFVFLLGRKLFGVTAGWVACASYALMSLSAAVLGMAAHATQFVVLFAVPATLLLWCAADSNERRTFFFSGLLYGLAFLMKQPGICFGCFGAFFLLWRAVRNRFLFTRDFAGSILTFGVAMILPFAFLCLAVVVVGDFSRFWFWTFNYASSYATDCTFGEGMQNFCFYVREQFPVYVGFVILAGVGLVVALRQPKFRGELIFALAFLFFSFLGTTPGLYFRRHYLVLLLPAVAILVGMTVTFLQSGVSQKIKIIPLLIFAAVFCWNSYLQGWMFFRFTPLQLCRVIYEGNPFIESLPVARYIREHSKPDARIAVIGSEPQIYFYSGRHSATGYIYMYPLMESQPYATAMRREMIGEIEGAKPEFVVLVSHKYSWVLRPASDRSIFKWVENFTRQFYEQTGVVDEGPDGKSEYFWDAAARNYHGFKGRYIIVYKLRPSNTPN